METPLFSPIKTCIGYRFCWWTAHITPFLTFKIQIHSFPCSTYHIMTVLII